MKSVYVITTTGSGIICVTSNKKAAWTHMSKAMGQNSTFADITVVYDKSGSPSGLRSHKPSYSRLCKAINDNGYYEVEDMDNYTVTIEERSLLAR